MPASFASGVLIICERRPVGESILDALVATLGSGVRFVSVWTRDEYEAVLPELDTFQAIVVGNDLGWANGLAIISEIVSYGHDTPIVMVTDNKRPDLVAAGFRLGVTDFLRSTELDRLSLLLHQKQDARDAGLRSSNSDSSGQSGPGQAISAVLTDYVFSFYLYPDGEIENEWRSEGVLRISGYSPEDIESIGWLQIVHPEDRQILTERLRHVRRGESPVIEYRILTRAGETRWIREFNRSIWSTEEQRYIRFVGSAQDITEERRSEVTRTKQLRVLEQIATGALPEQVFEEITELVELSDADVGCAIHVCDGSDGCLLLRGGRLPQVLEQRLREFTDGAGESVHSAVVADQRIIVISNLRGDNRWPEEAGSALDAGYSSLLAVPIFGRQHNVLGVITVYRSRIGEPPADEIERITVASRLAGIAIEHAAAEKALRDSQLQYRSLFDNNPHIVFSLDTEGRFQRINEAAIELIGYRNEELTGRPFTSVLVAGERERVWYYFRHSLRGESRQFETEIFTRHGRRLQISVTCVPWVVDGAIAGISGIAEDVSARVQLEQQLSHQAYHDALTELPNRVLFNERLAKALESAERSRDQIAVMFVDLDNFKMVNDSLGHQSGDEYLKVIATRLDGCVAPAGTVARFGGDEFTVLLSYPALDQSYPLRMADRIGAELAQPVLIRGHEINTGVSIGIAIQTPDTRDSADLVRQADIALYQAKRAGVESLYRVFEDSMHQSIVERVEVQRDLRRAIRGNEFEVHYQPVIDLQDGHVVMVEALVRWRHPTYGLLSPARFLPVAEETGQISDIDTLVLRTAAREIGDWNRSIVRLGQQPLRIGINLSARDFRHNDLADRIQSLLIATECDPSWIMFEITESMMMQDVALAHETVSRLREAGVGFSIDDFGTGYSSLAYLQRLPLDTLKIDRSFIDGLGGDDDDELMVRTIISLGASLSLEVVAEGIETPVQMERARELGCGLGQGYYIARPVPIDELKAYLLDSFRGARLERNLG